MILFAAGAIAPGVGLGIAGKFPLFGVPIQLFGLPQPYRDLDASTADSGRIGGVVSDLAARA